MGETRWRELSAELRPGQQVVADHRAEREIGPHVWTARAQHHGLAFVPVCRALGRDLGALIDEDRAMVRFLQWVSAFPTAAPAAAFE